MERDRLIRWLAFVKHPLAYSYSSLKMKSGGARMCPIAA